MYADVRTFHLLIIMTQVRRALRAKEVEKQKQRTNLNSPRSGRKAKRAPKTEDVAAARLAEENRKLKAMLSAAKAASPRVSKKKRSASRGSNRSPDGGGSVKRIPQTHNARAQHSYASMILSKSGRSSKSPLGRGRAEDDDEGGDDFGNDDDDNEAQEVDADADGDVEYVDEDPDLDEELGNSENAEGGGDAAAADGEGQADADASTAAADAAAAALGVDTISKMVQEQLAAEISKMVSLQTDEKAIVEAEKVKLSEALRSAGETHAAEVKGLETRLERAAQVESDERAARYASDQRAATAEARLDAEADKRRSAEVDMHKAVAVAEASRDAAKSATKNAEGALRIVTEAKDRAILEADELKAQLLDQQSRVDADRRNRDEACRGQILLKWRDCTADKPCGPETQDLLVNARAL